MGTGHVIGCSIFFFICLPLFTILGTYAAVEDIIDAVKNSPAPFTC